MQDDRQRGYQTEGFCLKMLVRKMCALFTWLQNCSNVSSSLDSEQARTEDTVLLPFRIYGATYSCCFTCFTLLTLRAVQKRKGAILNDVFEKLKVK